ncbi:MAG: hypothetical protein ACC612_12360 [Methanomethylovorans sp.]|uniref:hypothetical protein n=1 Tax=Methanomethylovorans sp. TaxID=2758717 RepID=UPI003531460A
MSSKLLILRFHLLQADKISFADRKAIKPMTASTPYSGIPTFVVIEIAPAAVDVAAVDTADVDTAVVNMVNKSTTFHYINLFKCA